MTQKSIFFTQKNCAVAAYFWYIKTKNNIEDIINQAQTHFSEMWRTQHWQLFAPELWNRFSSNLTTLLKTKFKHKAQNPFFDQEITPPIKEIEKYFRNIVFATQKQKATPEQLAMDWAETLEKAPFEYILFLLGQRFTSASTKNTLPPLQSTLKVSAFQPFNQHICSATRAWEKHVGRSEEEFWGEIKGTPKEREQKVRALIESILNHQTWWNIFYHYKHHYVYEVRIASGLGIRWSHDGKNFIGFLGPFLNDGTGR
ncbi:MAG: hypothetical protein MRY83_16975 [Flavobacteriales bacterium]|nr:hypothetical protein [Flavobacteriales bacterium]